MHLRESPKRARTEVSSRLLFASLVRSSVTCNMASVRQVNHGAAHKHRYAHLPLQA